MADLNPERPNLRHERPGLRPERPRLRPERPDVRPGRLDLRPERLDLRPERLDLRPERPDLRPEGSDEEGTNKRMNERTDRRTNESPPMFYRTSSPWGPLPKNRVSRLFLATVRSYTETNDQPTCFESLLYY